jgi:hypothetical protein
MQVVYKTIYLESTALLNSVYDNITTVISLNKLTGCYEVSLFLDDRRVKNEIYCGEYALFNAVFFMTTAKNEFINKLQS